MAKTVLLIEDNLTIQHLVREACQHEAFDVIIANDATDGIQKLQTLQPDIVLADAAMSGLNGFQLCQIIRGTASTQQVPVVLLTSHFAAYDHAKGTQAGVTAHLTKPFEVSTLLELLRSLQQEHSAASASPQIKAMSPEQPQSGQSDIVDAPHHLDQPSEVSVPSPHKTTQSPPDPSAPLHSPGPQPAAASSSNMPLPQELSQAVGSYLLTALQDMCQKHVTTWLKQLTPEIVQTFQRTIEAKLPEVLDELLQREITRLKVAFERSENTPQSPHKTSPEGYDASATEG